MSIKIANVIVDLPLYQTDQTFSYAIPSELDSLVAVGMRVHVPFGKSNRLIQGVVVGCSTSQDKDLKEITEVLDLEPVLNHEQLWLASELRHTVFSYKITLLKAMLPSLLNSSYDKELIPKNDLSSQDRLNLFGDKSSVLMSQ